MNSRTNLSELPTDLGIEPSTNLFDVSPDSPKSQSILLDFPMNINIADTLDEMDLVSIAQKVSYGYEEDKKSCDEWLNQVDDAQKLAKLVKEPKNHPLPKSANIKFPLITNACYQFAARTYPEIVKNGKVVKAAIIGPDPTGEKTALAKRVSDHMSYQLLFETSEWEQQLDTLLISLANIGMLAKKTFYDPLQQRIRSILCGHHDFIVNTNIQTLKEARRITHVLRVYLNDLVEGARAGIYLRNVVEELQAAQASDYKDEPLELLEQHRYLDLDDDGYDEPYIVTVCQKNNKVLRIVARFTKEDIKFQGTEVIKINPIHYFTDFHFLPSPCGKFHSMGFGTLMLHLNETVNTLLNQLIDAGTLANLQGGYIDARLKLPSGQSNHDPGEWKRVKGVGIANLKDGIVPINYKEPSQVLFSLVSLLIQTGRDLSSSTEVLKGTQPAERAPATTVLTLLDQGLKEIISIQRRIYRSLKDEFQIRFRMNSIYLEPEAYSDILDDPLAIAQHDYENKSLDILPIADPNLSSEVQRLAHDQALLAIINEPEVNRYEILKRHLETINMSGVELVLPPPQPKPPALEEIELKADIEEKAQKLNLKAREVFLKEQQFAAAQVKQKLEMIKLYADSVKTLAEAEAAEEGQQLEIYKTRLESLKTNIDSMIRQQELDKDITQQIIDQANIEKEREAIINETPPSE